jgi:hypothetical protein
MAVVAVHWETSSKENKYCEAEGVPYHPLVASCCRFNPM